ncbi:MAG: hypothetical protein Kow0073_02810 [Immundisolibacter sp.]
MNAMDACVAETAADASGNRVDVGNGSVNRRIFWDEDIHRLDLGRLFARSCLFVTQKAGLRVPVTS